MEKSGADAEFEARMHQISEDSAVVAERQALKLVRIAADFPTALRELDQANPRLAAELRRSQEQVAECRRRAQTNPDLLDMRLG